MSGASPGPLVQRWGAPASVVVVALVATGAAVAGNAGGRPGLAIAVIALQTIFAAGWLLTFTMPIDAAVLALAAVVVADVVLLRTRTATAGSVAGVLGLSVIAVLFHQIARRSSRGVTDAVAITLSVIALDVSLALLLPLRELADGRSLVFAGLVTAGAALLTVRALSGPDSLRRLVALVVAALVGLWCGAENGWILSKADGIYLGLATGACVLLVDRLLQRIPATAQGQPHRAYTSLINGLVPLFLAAPVAYLVGRAITSGSFAYVAGQLFTPLFSPGGG